MLSERIKELRAALHLSQTAFGEKVGVSIHVIKNIELNRADPNELLIAHIREVYGVSEHWLETGEGEMFETKSAEDIAIENALRSVGDSPALRAFFATWSKLNAQNRAVLERFIEDYVADYLAVKAADSIARDEAVFDDPEAIPKAE